MRKLLILAAATLGLFLLVAGITVGALYLSATAGVPEYEALVEVDPEAGAEASQRFESQLSALYSDTQSLDEWSTRITAEEANGWFATRLADDFPEYAQGGVREPRLIITPESVTLALRAEVGAIDGVVRVETRPFVTAEHELAIEVLSARLGMMQLPLQQLGARLDETPLSRLPQVRWTRGEGLTVIIDSGRVDAGEGRRLKFTGVDLREGELLLQGVCEALPEG